MSRFAPFAFGLALPLSLVSQAAFADLTPAQVWADWRQYMEGFGYTVSANETAQGGDLSVSDINLGFAVPNTSGSMSMSVGAIDFKQNSDGTVAILLPAALPMTITGIEDAVQNRKIDMTLNFTQTGHAMTASGSPEKMTYDYSADTVKMDLDQVTGSTQITSKDTVKMSFTGNTVSNTTTMTLGDMRGYEQSSSIASAGFTMQLDTPSNGGQKANITGNMADVTMSGTGTIPQTVPDMNDMAALLKAGFDVTGTIGYASGSSQMDVQDPDNGAFNVNTTSQGGALDVAIGAGGLAYGGSQQNLKMAVTAATIPFPIEFAMAESGFNLALPVQKSDTPQDFAFGITLGNFTMSDLIWGIFDSGGQLPRDPATIKLDLTGKAKVLADFMNPEAAARMTGAPGQLEALKLNTLVVDAAGAKLEGSGDIAFKGSGPSMVPGMGSPVGAIALGLAGGNGLLDKLTAMGLLPQEQAMGARMMMGIFAVPGDGVDTLKSRIEFTQDGQILANGQRIR